MPDQADVADLTPRPIPPDNRAPAGLAPLFVVRHLLTLGVWAIGLAVVAYLFGPLKNMLLGLIATGAVAAALHPLMRYVPGPRGLRGVIVGMVPVVLLGGLVAAGYLLLAKPIAEQVDQLPQAQATINDTLARWSEKLGLAEPVTFSSLAERVGNALTGGGSGAVVTTATQTLGAALVALAFVFFGSVYLLADDPFKLAGPLAKLMPEQRRGAFLGALADMVPRLRWWVIGVLFSMSIVAVASGIGYWLIGLKVAIPMALFTGVSEMVPTLGPALSFALALSFAAGQGGGAILGVAGVYMFVQLLESYILQPLVMRRAVHMPPLVTLFTVVFWGQVFGAPGLLLAIPINIVIWSFVDHLVIRRNRPPIIQATEP